MRGIGIVALCAVVVAAAVARRLPQEDKFARLQADYQCGAVEDCEAKSGLHLRADPVQHWCHFDNPCTFKTTPSYLNWDYVYLDINNLTSLSTVQVTVGNGVADITWGQGMKSFFTKGVDQPFSLCCNSLDCYQKEVNSYYYAGTCPPPKNMTIALWNRNDFEDETIILLFNGGKGPGPL